MQPMIINKANSDAFQYNEMNIVQYPSEMMNQSSSQITNSKNNDSNLVGSILENSETDLNTLFSKMNTLNALCQEMPSLDQNDK